MRRTMNTSVLYDLDQADQPDKMNKSNGKEDVRPKLIDEHVREALTSTTDEDLNDKKRQMFAINKSYSVEVIIQLCSLFDVGCAF